MTNKDRRPLHQFFFLRYPQHSSSLGFVGRRLPEVIILIAILLQMNESLALPMDLDRITRLTQTLVRIPSQGGIDSPKPICDALLSPLRDAGVKPQLLTWPPRQRGGNDGDGDGDGEDLSPAHAEKEMVVGVVAEIEGASPGPTHVLDAVVDTAPVGDEQLWSHVGGGDHGDPFSGYVCLEKQRLYGRGAADNKVAAAIFIEVGRQLNQQRHQMKGRTILFFDAAEHTGKFEGIESLLERYPPKTIDGVIIGYPGDDALHIGSRGFERTAVELQLSKERTTGALPSGAAAALGQAIGMLQQFDYDTCNPPDQDDDFGVVPPKRTLTALKSVAKEQITKTSGNNKYVQFKIRVGGTAYHSGSSRRDRGVNAITKACNLLRSMGTTLPFGDDIQILDLKTGNDGFSIVPDLVELCIAIPFPGPEMNVDDEAKTIHNIQNDLEGLIHKIDAKFPSKGISSVHLQQRRTSPKGDDLDHLNDEGYPFPSLEILSSVSVNIDTRLTPNFDIESSRRTTLETANKIEKEMNGRVSLRPVHLEAWPAFSIAREHPLRRAMESAIAAEHNKGSSSTMIQEIPISKVSGPSNVGNLLAKFGVPATTGYGVAFKGMHATDESIDLTTIPTAFAVHLKAMRHLMGIQ